MSDHPSFPLVNVADSPQSKPARCRCLSRACLLATVRQQWMLPAVALMAVFGALFPSPGLTVYSIGMPMCTGALFALQGLRLNLTEFRHALVAAHVHVMLQAFSLLLTPALYFGAVFHWKWEEALITRPYAVGTMAQMCMPTTASTSLVFTIQAGGDASAATLNMAGGQMIGAIVAPLTVALFLGASGSHQDLPHTLWKLCYEILLPLCGGVLTQVVLRRSAVGRRVLGVRAWGVLMITVLLLLFYLIFCKAFGPGSEMPSPTTLLVVIGWETGVHLLLVALAWAVSYPLAAPRRAMFVLVAPQKTEGLAAALLTIMFDGSPDFSVGELMLPIVVYHSVQMIFATALVPMLRAYVARRAAPKLEVEPAAEYEALPP